MSKLQEYDIYSYETTTFFLNHFQSFTSIQSLYIVADSNIHTKKDLPIIYHFDVLSVLHHLKKLKRVVIHSINSDIDSSLIKTIQSFPNIQFILKFYCFEESKNDVYSKLNSLYKVLIFFNEVSYELLNKSYPVLSINFNKYVENRNGLYFSDEEPMNVHSLNTLTDLIFKSIYPPFSLHIFKFEMSQNLDLSTIHLLHLEMVFNSTSTYPCVFPSTLTSLDLSIKTNAVSPETPILVLDNLHLEQLKIDGFKYDKTQCITMKVFPIKIKLNNCSNITITTTSNLSYEKTISTKEVSITQCSNISTITNTVLTILLLNLSDSNDILIETPNSILQSQNDVYVENIDEVNILDTNCINFKFVNTFTLRLTSISQFINIEYPYTLRLFEFNITPNHKNIELPLKENVIHPINSMDNLQLGCLKLTRIEEMNFFIQPTLYYIGLFNCTNIEIQSLGECIVDSFDFRGNRNCHFHDISLKNIVCSRSIYKQTGSGIKYVDVLLEDEYYPGSDDEDEYNEGELETLLEDELEK
ncbi:hypothetical protein QTN25_004197 [Entamoeba marina]